MDRERLKIVVAGNMVASVGGGIADDMNDVLDSLLFAQLVADSKAEKFEAPDIWFQNYRNELRALKWTETASRREAFEPEDTSSIVLSELIKDKLLSELPVTQAREISEMLDCIFALPETAPASLLFNEHAFKRGGKVKGESTIAFEVSILEKTSTLSSLFIAFKTTNVVDSNPFSQRFAGCRVVGEVVTRFSRRHWGRTGYQSRRDAVRGYLDDKRTGKILYVVDEVKPTVDDQGR
jgi:hypothetical protein